jgi:hypothetical protein
MNVSALLNPTATSPEFERTRKLIEETLDQSKRLCNSIYNNPWTMVVENQGAVWNVQYNNIGSVLQYELVDGPSGPMCIMSKIKGTGKPVPPGEEEVLFMGVSLKGSDSEVMDSVALGHQLHKHHEIEPVKLFF